MPLGGCRRPSLLQQLLKLLAILGRFDRIDARADDRHARVLQPPRQVERRLAAELHDDAIGLHAIADIEDVFDRERLEEQHVARVVVGAHGFGIRVDHHRFDAQLLQCETGMAAAVIELDALADAVRPAAEDDDGFESRVEGRGSRARMRRSGS